MISRFIDDNGSHYEITPEGIQMLEYWKNHHIKGTFLVVNYTPEHAVFMPIESEKDPVFYGVIGLESSIAEVLNYKVNTLIEAVLLPYEDKIIYDGLVAPCPLVFSHGMTDHISKIYEEAKRDKRIITSLKSLI